MKTAAWPAMAGLLLLASAGRATEPAASERTGATDAAPAASTAATRTASATSAQGMRVYIDPVTGELTDGPVTPEQRLLEEAPALPAPDYSKVTYEAKPDGTVVAHGNGQFETTSTIQIDVESNSQVQCSQTGSHAGHAHAVQPEQQP